LKKKVNEIYCQAAFPLNASQNAEVDAFKKLQENLKANNVILSTGIARATEQSRTENIILTQRDQSLAPIVTIQPKAATDTLATSPASMKVLSIAAAPITGRSALRDMLAGAYTAVTKTVSFALMLIAILLAALVYLGMKIRKHSLLDAQFSLPAIDDLIVPKKSDASKTPQVVVLKKTPVPVAEDGWTEHLIPTKNEDGINEITL